MAFSLVDTPLDAAAIRKSVETPESGALVTFDGVVRNHHLGRSVLRLEYQAYPALAHTEGEKIVAECLKEFAVQGVCCAHRVGTLEIGDIAVSIAVAAAHRDAAFAACRFLIDEIKQRVPIWKKEFYADGDSGWVNADGEAQSAGGLPTAGST